MKGWSKAVGAGLGYVVGGPIGAVLGYMAGHKLAPKIQATEGHLLIANILGFTTILLKVNIPPSSEECKETVGFISRLFQLDTEDEQAAAELLDRLLAVDLDIAAMAKSFKRHSDAIMRERLLEILATLCLLIHGTLKGDQLASLTRIAEALYVGQLQWQAIKSRYQAASPTLDIACSYALLELYPNSSNDQVRTAYRTLAKKYHPDLAPQLDYTAQRRHVEKMTLINAAYETIRAEKGIK